MNAEADDETETDTETVAGAEAKADSESYSKPIQSPSQWQTMARSGSIPHRQTPDCPVPSAHTDRHRLPSAQVVVTALWDRRCRLPRRAAGQCCSRQGFVAHRMGGSGRPLPAGGGGRP